MITLVRDPVQRNVSAFFQNLTEVIPDVYERHARGEMSVAEVTSAFLERYDHNAPLDWFETQLQPVFGIDVLASCCSTPVAACAIYEAEHARLLLIRVEDLSTCGPTAIADFLGLDKFELVTANIGREKRYHGLYAEFEAEVHLPQSYLTRMYDGRVARHFYTDAEIDAFRACSAKSAWSAWCRHAFLNHATVRRRPSSNPTVHSNPRSSRAAGVGARVPHVARARCGVHRVRLDVEDPPEHLEQIEQRVRRTAGHVVRAPVALLGGRFVGREGSRRQRRSRS